MDFFFFKTPVEKSHKICCQPYELLKLRTGQMSTDILCSLFTNNLYNTSGFMLPTRHLPIILQIVLGLHADSFELYWIQAFLHQTSCCSIPLYARADLD